MNSQLSVALGAFDERGIFVSDAQLSLELWATIKTLDELVSANKHLLEQLHHTRCITWLQQANAVLVNLRPPDREDHPNPLYRPSQRTTRHAFVRSTIRAGERYIADLQRLIAQSRDRPSANTETPRDPSHSPDSETPRRTCYPDILNPEPSPSTQSQRAYTPTAHPSLNGQHRTSSRHRWNSANLRRPEPRIETRVVSDGVITMLGNGESYRPNRPQSRDRTPPRTDTYRSGRDRSPRRSPPATDSYHPGSRDRSPRRRLSPYRRSPPRDNYRTRSPPRARSPPRRYSPRRDDDRRDRARSPKNARYEVWIANPKSPADPSQKTIKIAI